MDQEKAYKFSDAIKNAIDNINGCSVCGVLTDQNVCEICLDEERTEKLMIVENSKDVISFEKLGIFRGKYHVLNGNISPLNGIGPNDLNINNLERRITNENIKIVIIALSSTISGEVTALYIKKLLEETDVEVYRIGYGLPVGADIEYTDEITLTKALEGMKKI